MLDLPITPLGSAPSKNLRGTRGISALSGIAAALVGDGGGGDTPSGNGSSDGAGHGLDDGSIHNAPITAVTSFRDMTVGANSRIVPIDPSASYFVDRDGGDPTFDVTGLEFRRNDRVSEDFLLPRIVGVGGRGALTSDPGADDARRRSEVVTGTGPHPNLSDNRRRAIAVDYGMEEGGAWIPSRRDLLSHAFKRVGRDIDPAAWRTRDRRIALLSRDAVRGAAK